MIRTCLVSILHDRVLNTQQNRGSENGRVITLVSTDVDSLVTTAEMFHETWAQLVEVVIGMILLTRKVGWISPILLLSIFGLYNAWDFA
jgi:ATP-binding cassette subfamily C (CFTR/MRP) protein 1